MFARLTDVANVGGQGKAFGDQNININTCDAHFVENECIACEKTMRKYKQELKLF